MTEKDIQHIMDGWTWNLNLGSFSSKGDLCFNADESGWLNA